jgi:hypothetical protein
VGNQEASLAEQREPKLTRFELYLATAEKISDHRPQANAWMLSVNSVIATLYRYLEADKGIAAGRKKSSGCGRFRSRE